MRSLALAQGRHKQSALRRERLHTSKQRESGQVMGKWEHEGRSVRAWFRGGERW